MGWKLKAPWSLAACCCAALLAEAAAELPPAGSACTRPVAEGVLGLLGLLLPLPPKMPNQELLPVLGLRLACCPVGCG